MPRASSFTFASYTVDAERSRIRFTYRVTWIGGIQQTFVDEPQLPHIAPETWKKVPAQVLEPTLQALLLILGINYWAAFPTKTIHIESFALSRAQAQFWESLYLNGLAEFFYDMKMDFRGLISFPYKEDISEPIPALFSRPQRSLLLNGAGKDSILSAEMLKASATPFDFFAFAPTPAHKRISALVGANSINVTRRRDWRLNLVMQLYFISPAYPSVSTFTFIATLLAELLGYDRIIFSNERSADFGNTTYLGLPVNHQWCKSSEAERMINDYIRHYITPSISTHSLLRSFSELEIVKRFVKHPKYHHDVTSCNAYFWLTPLERFFARTPYWCNRCPKCVFLFAAFSAFLPKKEVVRMFGANLYDKKRLLPLFRRILGIEGFKPLDCVGEPEEIILAMHLASAGKEYVGDPAMQLFAERFPESYDFESLKPKVFSD